LGLALYAFNVVTSYILTSALCGISTVVFLLTIYEPWFPAKVIADAVTAKMVR
jgi:hypothetical protein